MMGDDRQIREIISQELARRIDFVIEQRVKQGLLTELAKQIREENDAKFKRLDALNTIVEQLQVLFATNRPTT